MGGQTLGYTDIGPDNPWTDRQVCIRCETFISRRQSLRCESVLLLTPSSWGRPNSQLNSQLSRPVFRYLCSINCLKWADGHLDIQILAQTSLRRTGKCRFAVVFSYRAGKVRGAYARAYPPSRVSLRGLVGLAGDHQQRYRLIVMFTSNSWLFPAKWNCLSYR